MGVKGRMKEKSPSLVPTIITSLICFFPGFAFICLGAVTASIGFAQVDFELDIFLEGLVLHLLGWVILTVPGVVFYYTVWKKRVNNHSDYSGQSKDGG
jgi:hypothetical protein